MAHGGGADGEAAAGQPHVCLVGHTAPAVRVLIRHPHGGAAWLDVQIEPPVDASQRHFGQIAPAPHTNRGLPRLEAARAHAQAMGADRQGLAGAPRLLGIQQLDGGVAWRHSEGQLAHRRALQLERLPRLAIGEHLHPSGGAIAAGQGHRHLMAARRKGIQRDGAGLREPLAVQGDGGAPWIRGDREFAERRRQRHANGVSLASCHGELAGAGRMVWMAGFDHRGARAHCGAEGRRAKSHAVHADRRIGRLGFDDQGAGAEDEPRADAVERPIRDQEREHRQRQERPLEVHAGVRPKGALVQRAPRSVILPRTVT